jgi:alpha-beta hydrolase superfamily lysophospholipase
MLDMVSATRDVAVKTERHKTPTHMLLASVDEVVNNDGAFNFFNKIKDQNPLNSLKVLQGYHQLHKEPGTKFEVFTSCLSFIT